MNRRIIALPIVAISLLSSCSNVPDLRSDIAEFITSFSYDESTKVYLDCGYVREDISHEKTGEVITVKESISINVKNKDNLVYDYRYLKSIDNVEKENKHYYISKSNDHYLYYNGGENPVSKSEQEVRVELITKFFYTVEFEGTHTGAMYIADSLLGILPNIQRYVTINKEDETLTYDKPFGPSEAAEGYEFSELLVVDKYGMTKSCDIYQTNGITSLKTTIKVTNNT